MSRPLYENSRTLAAEKSLKLDLEAAWGHRLVKNPRAYGVDWSVCDGRTIIGLVEAKCRRYNVDSFDHYLISAKKIKEAVEYAEFYRVPFVLVVRWSGVGDDPIPGDRMVRIRYSNMTKLKIEIAGRKDRNDPADYEPCAMIPSEMFTEIEEFPSMYGKPSR